MHTRLFNQKWFRALFHRRILVSLIILFQILFLIYLVVDTSRVSSAIAIVFQLISLSVALYIVSKRDKGAFKLTWVFLILIFPLFGGLLYLLFHLQMELSPLHRDARRIEEGAKPFFLLSDDRAEDACTALPHYRTSIRYLQGYAGFPIYDETDATYYPVGEALWDAMCRDMEEAKHYIFLEYFIIQEGVMWDRMLEILKRKAASGVTVRIVYDDFGCFFTLPADYPTRLKAMGIDCAIFNRFKPVFSVNQNNRNHRKILVIDGEIAFTGGVNLSDEYINAISPHGHWKDTGVRIKGRGAWSMALIFLKSWTLCNKKAEQPETFYPDAQIAPPPSRGFVQPYADSPLDRDNVAEHVYLRIIESAQHYLYITTPYLIVDDSMISALTLAAKSGVDVRIMTPHIWDKRIVHMTTRSYYRELIKAGVRIYEYDRGFVHAKSLVSDDVVASVGTANLDFRSLYMHFECGVLLYDSPAVLQVKEDFVDTLNHCHEITKKECGKWWGNRMVQDILRLFAPLM